MHLHYIHRMRAIAIMAIVCVHTVDQLTWTDRPDLHRFLENLFQGSTVLFFMIAGFLFHHLSKRFDYRDYLQRKIKHVLLPFVVVSAPGIAALVMRSEFAVNHPELAGIAIWQQVLFLLFYAGSQWNYPLWFVPIMATFFLMAPAFMVLFKRPAWFFGLLLVLIPYSLVSHRADVSKYHHLELTAYYLGPYMLGMWASMRRDVVNAWVERHLGSLILAYLALLLGFTWLTPHEGTYVAHAFSFEKGFIDWVLAQKLVLFFALIGLTRKLEAKQTPRLDYLGDVSFPIFFLHVYVLLALQHANRWQAVQGNLLTVAAGAALAIAGSVAIVMLARATLRRHSRLLIGA
jgi:probable poly-beta-1,6-N-acetyl-D-glucosamine export protein